MEKTCTHVWNNCLLIIKDNIPAQSFKTWFEPIKALRLDGNVLTIQVPSLFFYEWLEEHYVGLLRKTVKKQLGEEGRLEYNIVVEKSSTSIPYTTNMPSNGNGAEGKNQSMPMPISLNKDIKNPFVIPGLKKLQVDPQLNQNYTFENFIEGDCNRLARSAGYAVAGKPGGTSFNPLMIYGGVGLGKTHLAQAIGNEIKRTLTDKLVLYVSCEKFTQQFVDALKNNNINDFVNFYQAMDVLIMDDVHNFAGKEKTQDIFFHIFNHLHQSGKQLIITSDKAPKDLSGLEERLLSRFKWGLSADLQIPDLETRMAILNKKMYSDGIELPSEVIEYVAHNIDNNVRELEGAMVSLLAQSTLNKKEIDLNLAKSMLKNFIKNSSKEISMEYIQKLVCEYFEVPIEMVKSKTRKREIVQARQISMYLAKLHTKTSLKSIGAFFGGRDHSTVIYACQTVDDLIDTDKKFKGYVADIQKKLKMS
ncbi:MAG: chromosomal replication initiation protein DnaA [Sphingobacteriales bacterium 17-39-43]|jgi:chromosomal replication initiator protein|uniref:chromosomal replication initiator protein DnaA n=1 Tax=Daejeonella sp. TaxID=2805397 RepID=UPI000BD3C1DF|nr:chromosomal replication initiator protein DnaA [Daejeonella sp.]OYZ31455.1 MAG: chromosomal replication initiation protein DnaA [Sphingobacteriales bacterium 16-39-50]OZA24739.1 MAG: chromosomal replication initiation protein DnaA [Sphingobacteriales bacterium 17-39-43]MDP2415658.1 chromosomal replication initiator protein DnaA [Daejeonella sp.]HQT22615.1 chromosomal replication initiator protein DnaA [Daejeonella sp.]HQT57695.1 chromosomal replication initiator protein DnaA [Daejeonella sp